MRFGGFARHPVMLDYVRRYARRHAATGRTTSPSGCRAATVPAPGGPAVSGPISAVSCSSSATRSAQPAATAWPGSRRCAGLSTAADIANRILAHQREHDGLLAAEDLESFRCQVDALGRRAASASTARRSRCTPAARGVRVRSCSRRSRSPRRPEFATWSTARTPTSIRSRRPSSSCSPIGRGTWATRIAWMSPSIHSSARPGRPSGARRSIPGTRLPACRFPARFPGTPRTSR